jgi:nitrogen fixation NifU-like protein
MSTTNLYKSVLLDHFRHPRNKSGLEDADIIRRGSNPRCGDEVEVGLFIHEDKIDKVKFRGRGCSICIASASMMTEAVSGRSAEEARHLCDSMQNWFGQSSGLEISEAPEGLEALSAVREYPARRRCVLLSWEALTDAINDI